MPQETKKQKRGGQPGNHNATKHGIYSESVNTSRIPHLLIPMSSTNLNLYDEIGLIRSSMTEIINLYNQSPLPEPAYLDLLIRAVKAVAYLTLIQLRVTPTIGPDDQTTMIKAMINLGLELAHRKIDADISPPDESNS